MDECIDGTLEKWYEKIDDDETMEDRRKVHHSGEKQYKCNHWQTRKIASCLSCLGKEVALDASLDFPSCSSTSVLFLTYFKNRTHLFPQLQKTCRTSCNCTACHLKDIGVISMDPLVMVGGWWL